MTRPEKQWIVFGSYAIDAEAVLYINTAARFLGPAEDDDERDAWGEVPPSRQVERTGVEIVWGWPRECLPLRFVDGSAEAEDLRAFVQTRGGPQDT